MEACGHCTSPGASFPSRCHRPLWCSTRRSGSASWPICVCRCSCTRLFPDGGGRQRHRRLLPTKAADADICIHSTHSRPKMMWWHIFLFAGLCLCCHGRLVYYGAFGLFCQIPFCILMFLVLLNNRDKHTLPLLLRSFHVFRTLPSTYTILHFLAGFLAPGTLVYF